MRPPCLSFPDNCGARLRRFLADLAEGTVLHRALSSDRIESEDGGKGMKNRNVIIVGVVAIVLIVVLWSRLVDLGGEIYKAFA